MDFFVYSRAQFCLEKALADFLLDLAKEEKGSR
jgi:hypothetical protein